MELNIVTTDVSIIEVKEPIAIKELNDLEMTAVGGGCAESTPY